MGQPVTSSCWCKKAEGVVRQFICTGCEYSPHPYCKPAPVLIESVKDGIKDSLHALHVGEQHHGSGAPADSEEAGSAPGGNWVVTGPTPLVFV